MGKILVGLDDELEKRFREGVFRRYGMKKGNLTNAISKAIELWLNPDSAYNVTIYNRNRPDNLTFS